MSLNLIMIDSAHKDPRSVSAMLRGCGDARKQAWLDFEYIHAHLFQEDIMEKFRKEARYGRIKIGKQSALNFSNKWLVALIAFVIVVF